MPKFELFTSIPRTMEKDQFQYLYGLARIHNKMTNNGMLNQSVRMLGDDYCIVSDIRIKSFVSFSVPSSDINVRLAEYKRTKNSSFCKDVPF